jgi:hypothetical protein
MTPSRRSFTGMCSDLHNTHKVEFPRNAPPLNLNAPPLDLNVHPYEEEGNNEAGTYAFS